MTEQVQEQESQIGNIREKSKPRSLEVGEGDRRVEERSSGGRGSENEEHASDEQKTVKWRSSVKGDAEAGEQESKEDDRGFFEKHARAKPALIVFAILMLVGGGLRYLHHRHWESTDDAQVDGNVYSISSRISGTVVNVEVNDGDHVQAGQTLVEIDTTDYGLAHDRARAEYEAAQAAFSAAQINIPVAQQQQTVAEQQRAEAEANANKANADVARYRQLIMKREISQQQYDQAVATATSQNATVAARAAAVKAAGEQVTQAASRLKQANADVDRAHTALKQAQLNVGYTKVVAPVEGIIGRRTVTAGQSIQPGQDLMSLVPLNNVWITANFRETQLRHMKPGQRVLIKVDTYGKEWNGRVSNIGGATGAKFSLLPPENASGNYVKVVQRIPVRIDLDNGNRDGMLRPGMSVEPKVRVR